MNLAQLAALPADQLRALRADPKIGDVMREHIDAALGSPEMGRVHPAKNEVAPKTTDPRDRMTQVERRMADVLEMRKRSGEVREWWYEALKLRVGLDQSWYIPDYLVLLTDGSLEVIEVKGKQVWEDSRVKWKAAKMLYPFMRWRFIQWCDGEWREMYA